MVVLLPLWKWTVHCIWKKMFDVTRRAIWTYSFPSSFLIFLHDLKSSTEVTFVKYVGQFAECMSICTSSHLEMSEFLSFIGRWSVVNGLTPNPSKYKPVNFRLRHEQLPNTLFESHKTHTIGDSLMKTKSKVIHLGVGFYIDLSRSSRVLLLSKIFSVLLHKEAARFWSYSTFTLTIHRFWNIT